MVDLPRLVARLGRVRVKVRVRVRVRVRARGRLRLRLRLRLRVTCGSSSTSKSPAEGSWRRIWAERMSSSCCVPAMLVMMWPISRPIEPLLDREPATELTRLDTRAETDGLSGFKCRNEASLPM